MSLAASVHDTIRAAVAAGAMATCKYREGPDPVEVVPEIPGTTCKHPGQMKQRTCAVMHCPIASRLAPQLAENLGASITNAALDKAGLGGGAVAQTVSGILGRMLGGNGSRTNPTG